MSPVIDDEGRLFGAVNVIDALVVLFVLAVLVSGVAVIGGLGSDGEPAERYATLDLGEQPSYIADRIEAGDESIEEPNGDAVSITDVYVGPSTDGNATIVIRAKLTGQQPSRSEGRTTFEFDGEPLRLGRQISIDVGEYEVSGQVRRIDPDDPSLSTGSTPVLVHANVSASTADVISVGDRYLVDGHTVATIDSLQIFPDTDNDRRYVVLGLELSTVDRAGTVRYGSHPVSVGARVPFRTNAYGITGTVLRRGSTDVAAVKTPVVLRSTVDATTAQDVNAGDVYRIAGESIVTVESVTIYGTEQPNQKRLIVGATVLTREEAGSVLFGRQELRVGTDVPIRTDSYDLIGSVIRKGSLEEPGRETTRELTIRLENVAPAKSESLSAGMAERGRDERIARVLDVDRQPAEVVLESDDGNIYLREHPRNVDVELTVEILARETDDGLLFKAETVQIGDSVDLDLGTTAVRGTVVDFE